MSSGDCFHCHQPGHWAKNCPLKTTTKPTAAAAPSPPDIHCPCNAGPCNTVTSKTEKNPNRRFYTCPSCGYFKWCDQGLGDCGFFKWEDGESLLHETELDSDGNVKRNRLGVVVELELNPASSSESNTLGNRIVDTLPVNPVTVGKESIPVFAGFNDQGSVSNSIVPSFDLITLYDDAVRLETKEPVLPSVAPKHLDTQVETLCGNALEAVESSSQNTSDLVLNANNKPEHIHQRAATSGETEASYSGSSSMMVLIEQYKSEKLYLESISMKHVEALTAYTGSYKQLESLRDRAHSLKKQLLEVEKQVKLCEAETSEFAASVQEVSGEMAKSQKKMVEIAGKVAKEVRVDKQRD
ncbi:putative DNA topoisomerase transcription factor interactor and regulator CCHC(Zn) family [Arabidopsis thaliana]|uniref:Uncharacterized protein n=2 Tax=Arabidopsis thaliana TaxID=3702 RepID=A0A178W7A5_ARATH|nr:GRF zinc finger / Zinc knuckle protein [Arabidopsis thaliana]AAG00874.1 Hypothetical protein [Arabidopsis thaliana]AAG51116.1 hypothetical protein [Arabidopsis thaliana]AEE33164.1 GRF zinc finger / Zinc knuckle protein [Arabidopsis thaliana]OAP14046.1 hypothetical protein AXX17_AT1G49390 [Arabidopsis thaliana]CAA0295551.1 unnamed protein product [Arabidopsis thaliana]|eukprot:NP_175890.1 GRF zinc finger / Zinc knuckle protein [Arabidopsis thaliana]